METKTALPILKSNYEVIGQGEMIYSPCQVGDWWVTSAADYQGKIPPEIQKKLFAFLSQGVEIQGMLIAEDMREIEAKRKQEEQKKEVTQKAVATGLGAVLTPLIGIGLGMVYLIATLLAYDPMLIAVTKKGEWICLGIWYE